MSRLTNILDVEAPDALRTSSVGNITARRILNDAQNWNSRVNSWIYQLNEIRNLPEAS